MIKILCGNEPYLIKKEKEKLLSGCDSFDITVFTEVTREALDFVSVPSFFGGTKFAVFDVVSWKIWFLMFCTMLS